jgi:thermitase
MLLSDMIYFGTGSLLYIILLSWLQKWFVLNFRSHWGKITLALILIYLLSILLNGTPMGYKLFVLCRDLIVAGVSGVAVYYLRSLKKPYAIALSVVLVSLYIFWLYKPVIRQMVYARLPEMENNSELLLELDEGKTIESILPILEKYDITYKQAYYPKNASSTIMDNYYLLDVPKSQMHRFFGIKKKIRSQASMEWLEVNEVFEVDLDINENTPPGTAALATVNDPEYTYQWGLRALNIQEMNTWLQESGHQPKKTALVCVLDTGIEREHQDINNNYLSFNTKDDVDGHGHGTHCGGVIAAVSNNAIGTAGISYTNQHIRVTSIQVLGKNGVGSQNTIIDGIIKAADLGADVISLSLGGPTNDSKQRAFEKAIQYANEAGAIVVVAAGNSNTNAKKFAPANAAGVITIAAVDAQLNKATFSNTTSDIKMKLAAPGVNIRSTFIKNSYKDLNGTSMATPFIAGLAGIIKSYKPDISTAEMYELLESTAIDTKSPKTIGKLPDAYQAMNKILN